jgi:hypothetical protein
VVDQLVKQLLQTAAERPSLFGLIDKLIDSVSAFNIYLKLLAILADYSSSPTEPKPAAAKPLKVEPVKPVVTETVSSAAVIARSSATKQSSEDLAGSRRSARDDRVGESRNYPTEINWDEFVTAVKNLNKTCGSSLVAASHDYDGETLTLYLTSKIFREKMKETKWKGVLKNALVELYDQPPKIDIADGPKPKNAALSAVADIMGGGEAL